MKKFFMDLLSGQTEVSSKRFAALFALVNLVILTWIATLNDDNLITPEFMFDALLMIAGGGFGLSVVEKVLTTKNSKKTDSNEQNPTI